MHRFKIGGGNTMIENLMIISIFISTLLSLVVIGLLIIAGLYFVLDNLRERRKEHIQRRIEKEMIRLDDFAMIDAMRKAKMKGEENGDD